MKTIEELYNEVMASEEMKKEFLALKPEEVEGFAKKHGCEATLDEIKAFLTARNTVSGELSDDELEQVTGGKSDGNPSASGEADSEAAVVFLYQVGQQVEVITGNYGSTDTATIMKRYIIRNNGHYYPYYRVRPKRGPGSDIAQNKIQIP